MPFRSPTNDMKWVLLLPYRAFVQQKTIWKKVSRTFFNRCFRLKWRWCSSDERPHFLNQTNLNDFVKDLGLTKETVELLGSYLNQWNLMEKGCKTLVYRKRHQEFSQYFAINGVPFEEMDPTHKSDALLVLQLSIPPI